jgi:mRNA interferase MazF
MSVLTIKHGYLYLADLNPRIGTEPGKLRPVLVIQTDFLNQAGHESTWILPCTTLLSDSNLLRVRIPEKVSGNHKECDIMIDQNRTIDNKRFKKLIGQLPALLLSEVKEKLRLLGEL